MAKAPLGLSLHWPTRTASCNPVCGWWPPRGTVGELPVPAPLIISPIGKAPAHRTAAARATDSSPYQSPRPVIVVSRPATRLCRSVPAPAPAHLNYRHSPTSHGLPTRKQPSPARPLRFSFLFGSSVAACQLAANLAAESTPRQARDQVASPLTAPVKPSFDVAPPRHQHCSAPRKRSAWTLQMQHGCCCSLRLQPLAADPDSTKLCILLPGICCGAKLRNTPAHLQHGG